MIDDVRKNLHETILERFEKLGKADSKLDPDERKAYIDEIEQLCEIDIKYQRADDEAKNERAKRIIENEQLDLENRKALKADKDTKNDFWRNLAITGVTVGVPIVAKSVVTGLVYWFEHHSMATFNTKSLRNW